MAGAAVCAALGDLPRNEVLLLAHPDKAVWHGVGKVDKPPPVGWAGGLLALKARAGRVLTDGDGKMLGLRWRSDVGVDLVPSVRVDCEAGQVVVRCPVLRAATRWWRPIAATPQPRWWWSDRLCAPTLPNRSPAKA